MPKKTNLDENKKKEIENLIEELKDNATDITKAEIEELESLLDDVLKMESEPWYKTMGKEFGFFSLHFILMYLVSILTFGLYFEEISIENMMLVFLIGGIVSIILTLFEDLPRNPLRRHFVSINLMIFVFIVMGIYIINRDIYSVFNTSITCVFYLFTVVIIYYLMDSLITRKIHWR
jgi:hypothetical protein